MNPKIPIIAIIGPTAVGKTELSIKLAESCHGEIISVDSIQVYRDAPILSGAVTTQEMRGVRHHFVGHLSANEEPTNFISSAVRCIKSIHHRGFVPILCGGSLSLTRPLLFHPFIKQQDLLVISLNCSLDILGTFIDHRINQMARDGIQNEIKHLFELERSDTNSASDTGPAERGAWKAIGYPELRPICCKGVDPERAQELFEEGLQLMKANTREYAKRQLQQLHWAVLPALTVQMRTCYVLNVESKHKFHHDVVRPATGKCKRWLALRHRTSLHTRADSRS
ncbi:hypothetical protein EJ05DRAFT_466898 [Pseudovirgaria hyperparasitica]|uniref:tRNA isopentenyltransferase n=1 Tax=Pseudovirgaria hyperparasitica TaxID=470096 RepID=A0A6A6W1U7_9PEZI|nr:uncharacterized protein EJ05DRAFT_466898 [Pseudovirgaria hyperparasitica]KAF2756523.1 hypothetical protein EJ05DRAFT_466898 [Pseudovirgaria hyperparasitica]